ncbi:hypothetical protein HYH03_010463 [Edaphochlamys debaryana]|uniref:Pseudouridine synthase I TruA alpha/beta domain-containing protein n=1 Tax=Edaphochlamys debaryana TaxID=47281 RepID=A0A835XZF9_9CHLO|nr:hypothetical protein HYH03_010463 [Edaphochlamys debaryana]|eukprot:KAG2491256.1 hypothetical protein HYH03_010463 [Edaphochlamys debaryana]
MPPPGDGPAADEALPPAAVDRSASITVEPSDQAFGAVAPSGAAASHDDAAGAAEATAAIKHEATAAKDSAPAAGAETAAETSTAGAGEAGGEAGAEAPAVGTAGKGDAVAGDGEGNNPAAKPAGTDDSKRPKDKAKRSVALHTGYVGTGFKGSSINRTLGEDVTIEQVLEKALFAAGCISEANFGSFSKIRWTRASRTDKGVHSLGTVMGLRMLVDDSCYSLGPGGDCEGLSVAAAVNAHLPPQIRIFTVQRTNKKFSARHMCEGRTYQYYLPSSMLELKGDGGEEDARRIAAFRDALQCYVGAHPFHNYTRRQIYMPGQVSNQPYKSAGKKWDKQDKGKDGAAGGGRKRGRGGNDEPGGGAAGGEAEAAAAGTAAAAEGGEAGAEPTAAAAEASAEAAGGADAAMAEAGAGAAPAADAAADAAADTAADAAAGGSGDGDAGGGDGSEPPAKRARPDASASPGDALQERGGRGRGGEGRGRGGEGRGRGRGGEDRGRGGRGRGGRGRRGSDDEEDDEEEEDEEGGRGELDEDSDSGGEEEAAEAEAEGAAGGEEGKAGSKKPRKPRGRYGPDGRVVVLRWQSEIEPGDKVTQSHYRRIHSFTAADPKPLVEGGTPCLMLQVVGQSFMLHHIRHMIGSAVAVALGLIPKEVLQASLYAPARATLPRAPPHTLLLADCTFGRFPHQHGPGDNDLRRLTGERLAVRFGGRAAREAFREEVLLPALQGLVELDEWRQWRESLRGCYPFPQEALDGFLGAYRAWCAEKDSKRKAREERWAAGRGEGGGGEGAEGEEGGAREGGGEGMEYDEGEGEGGAEEEGRGGGAARGQGRREGPLGRPGRRWRRAVGQGPRGRRRRRQGEGRRRRWARVGRIWPGGWGRPAGRAQAHLSSLMRC